MTNSASMNKSFLHLDWGLILPVGILLFISLVTLFSIQISFFRSQLIFVIVASFLFLGFSFVNFRFLQYYALPMYVVSVILLLVVLVLGIESRGAVRWLDILGFRIQFSEMLKPFLALSLASFLAQRNNTAPRTFFMVLAYLAPIAFLIYRQPDLGNALIYVFTVMLTLILFGFSLRWFVMGLVGIGVSIPLLWRFLHQYQRERLLTFFHITNDPLGISYNAIQSVIAVGSGMWFGKGLGQGTQSTLRFLPERHTDFIFATLSEELGLVGGLIVIVAFAFLLYRLYRICQQSSDEFSKVYILATFSLFFVQFFINIGMNIGIMPIVGVTLPFVSYGGSSLLSSAIFLGLVAAMGKEAKNKNVLEIT